MAGAEGQGGGEVNRDKANSTGGGGGGGFTAGRRGFVCGGALREVGAE